MGLSIFKLKKLLEVGDVGIYRTMDGGFGVSLDFYDQSYYLAHPADTVEEAVNEMYDEWRVKSALKYPEYNKKAYKDRLDEVSDMVVTDSDAKVWQANPPSSPNTYKVEK